MNKRWKETLIFVCFLVVATAFWYGHAMTSVRTEVIPVRVQYTGVDSHVTFGDSLPAMLSVEVRDVGQRLKAYYKDQPTITINLHAQTEDNTGTVDITEEQLRSSVNSVLQGTSKVLAIEPAVLHGSYYHQEEKRIPVVLCANITPADEYQFAVEPRINESSILVYGAPKILENLDTLYTQTYSLTDLKDTLYDKVSLALPTGVRSEVKAVALVAVTERFTEKVFTLPITYSAPNDSLSLRLFPAEASVTIRCAVHDFNQVQTSDIVLQCAFPRANEKRLAVVATSNNPKITMIRVNPSYVEYIVEQK